MANKNAVSPYGRLKQSARKAIFKLVYPHRVSMWRYPVDQLKSQTTFRLDDLAERTRAASQLGYDVQVVWDDKEGLVIWYVKAPKSPDYPLNV